MKKIYIMIAVFIISFNIYAESYKAIALVNANNVRLRKQPNLSSQIINNLNKNQMVTVLNRSSKSQIIDDSDEYWFEIEILDNQHGWVFGKYISNFSDFEWVEMNEIMNVNGTQDSIKVKYKYPAIWDLNGSVFKNYKGHKIAEFLPGLKRKSNDKPKNSYNEEDDEFQILLTEELILPSKRKCQHTIEKVIYAGGSPNWLGIWYPNIFLIEKDNIQFQMVFYEKNEKPIELDLWIKIMDSVQF